MRQNAFGTWHGAVNTLVMASLLLTASLIGCEGDRGPVGPRGLTPVIIVPYEIKSVQLAIDLLPQHGGTVYIKSGRYNLPQGIHIRRSNVTLRGERGTVLVLDQHVNQPAILIGTDVDPPTVAIENITIEDIEIDGNRDFQDSEKDPERPWIKNNCIDIRKAHDVRITGVDASNGRSGGLVVSWGCRHVFVNASSFHGNEFDGIALYDSESIQVSNFFCFENDASGLSLDNDLKDVLFSNGALQHNGDNGLFARNSEDLSFNNLMIADNITNGCFLSHESLGTDTGVKRLFFSSCSFFDNGGYGILLPSSASESPNNAVVGCLFSGNGMGAIQTDPGSDLYLEANIFQ